MGLSDLVIALSLSQNPAHCDVITGSYTMPLNCGRKPKITSERKQWCVISWEFSQNDIGKKNLTFDIWNFGKENSLNALQNILLMFGFPFAWILLAGVIK